jgi:hypothetical protein
VRNFGERESIGLGGEGECGGGERGGEIGSEGTGELVILSGFEGIGSVERKKKANRLGSVGGHCA